jgi:Domain of unknown function (DUF4173)
MFTVCYASMTVLQHLPSQINRLVWISVSVFVAALADTFFWGKILGWNLPIFVGLLIIIRFVVEWMYTNRVGYNNVLASITALFLSFSAISQSGSLIRFFNILAIWYLILLVWKPGTLRNNGSFLSWLGIEQMISVFDALAMGIKKLPKAFLRFPKTYSKNINSAVIGGLISIPLLLFFGILLILSDNNFGNSIAQYLQNITNLFTIETLIRVCVIAINSLILFGFGFLVKPTKLIEEKPLEKEKRAGLELESLIPLGSLALLFGVYLGFQLSYLIGGKEYIASIESTFAEFAKRGFFELLIVGICIFALILIWDKVRYGLKYLRAKNFALISVIVVSETVIMLVSAWNKLALYVDGYGYTNLRLFTQVWIVCMGVSLLLLIRKLTSNLKTYTLVYVVSWVFITGLATLNIIQPDRYIANYNLKQSNWNTSDIRSYDYDGLVAIKPLISDAKYRGTLDFGMVCKLKDKQDYLLNTYQSKSWYEKSPSLNKAKSEFETINLVDAGRVNECYKIQGSY